MELTSMRQQLAYLGSVRYVGVGDQQDDIVLGRDCSQHQNVGTKPCNSAW